jgi:hypothetical protein
LMERVSLRESPDNERKFAFDGNQKPYFGFWFYLASTMLSFQRFKRTLVRF